MSQLSGWERRRTALPSSFQKGFGWDGAVTNRSVVAALRLWSEGHLTKDGKYEPQSEWPSLFPHPQQVLLSE